MTLSRRLFLAFALTAALAAVLAPTALGSGNLSQPAGPEGCVSRDGSGGCSQGAPLDNPTGIVASPDGKHVYVGSFDASAINAYSRDQNTGALTKVPGGCVSADGSGGQCKTAIGIDSGVNALAISRDGRHVYAVSFFGSSVTTYFRDPGSGALEQLGGAAGCSSASGGGGCAVARGLNGARGVSVSPEGRSVYVGASGNDSVAVFSRNQETGALTQPAGADGCIAENPAGTPAVATCRDGHGLDDANATATSPDGKTTYVVSFVTDSVAVLDRNAETSALTQDPGTGGCVSDTGAGTCVDGKALNSPSAVIVSGDDANVYVSSGISDAIAVFKREADGNLSQLPGTDGCIAEVGGATCADGVAMDIPQQLALSPSGRSLYLTSLGSGSVSAFDRDTASGKLTQLATPNGCMSEDGTGGACLDGRALAGAVGVDVSPDGAQVYAGSSDADAVAVLQRGNRPVCSDVSASTAFEAPVALTLACSDPNGEPLTWQLTSGPAAGTLSAIDPGTGATTYTPAAGFFGADSFTYRVVAEDGASNVATGSLLVNGPTKRCFLVKLGTAAAETLTGTPFGDTLNGLAGNDRLEGLAGNDCLDGGDGRDRLIGGDGTDTLRGRGGRDSLDGGAADDTLSGAGDNDKLSGGAGNDKLGGSSGNDRLSGGAGADPITGGSGNDVLSGGDGNDKLTGDSGNDRLTGGAGKNSYRGGSGNDDIRANNKRRETIDCGKGRDRVRADRTDRVKGCEVVIRYK
jgi:DNA-binding beta-propeller fold protein YncE